MLAALCVLALLTAAADLVLRGTVRDQSGLPVPRALVYVDGTQTSAETDNTGRFELTLPAPAAGTLVVFRDGFSAVSVPFDPLALEPFQIELTPAPISDSVTVTAPRRPALPASAYAMRPLDVVRTPGAAADLMRALQTLPGVAQVDEGAGLYVRGGDTSEVLVLLDDAVVFHPYRQETPGGGLFGSVEPFLLEGRVLRHRRLLREVRQRAQRGARHARPEASRHRGRRTSRSASPARRCAQRCRSASAAACASPPTAAFRDCSSPSTDGRTSSTRCPAAGTSTRARTTTRQPPAPSSCSSSATGDHVGVGIDSLNFSGLLKSSTSSNIASLHWERVIGGVAGDRDRRPDAIRARAGRRRAEPRHHRPARVVARDSGARDRRVDRCASAATASTRARISTASCRPRAAISAAPPGRSRSRSATATRSPAPTSRPSAASAA